MDVGKRKFKEEFQMIINHNLPAMGAYRNLGMNNATNQKSMEKLSSGLRINRAGDDAAGLAISEKMRGQIKGLNQASRNAQDAVSLIQTAEGALSETHSILQRMRELATQAANDTNIDVDRNEIQKEMNQLTSEINRIGNTTEFNKQKLLNGDKSAVSNEVRGSGTITFKDLGASEDLKSFTLNVGGKSYTVELKDAVSSGASKAEVAMAVKDAIMNDAKLNKLFDVSLGQVSGATTLDAGRNDGTLHITQKIGMGGADEAALTTTISLSGSNGSALTTGTASLDKALEAGTTEGKNGVRATSSGNQSMKMQIGANEGQSMSIDINDMRAKSLGISSTVSGAAGFAATTKVTNGTNSTEVEYALDVTSHDRAANAISVINNAIEYVSAERSKLGAFQNRLEHTINNLGTSAENLQAAESRIRDVDMANEMMNFTRSNILSQASQSMLAQANQKPQSVLQLLG